MYNTETINDKIEEINLEILKLLNRRANLIREISEPIGKKLIFTDHQDNESMMETILKNNTGPLYDKLVKKIFNEIFSCTLNYTDIKEDKELLISNNSKNDFFGIQKMFNLPTSDPIIIAGPCAVENAEYLDAAANFLSKKGIKFLRGGAYKPRTSPYEFQGLKEEALKILKNIGNKYNMFTVTEVLDTREVEKIAYYADVLQVGSRNMYNYELLKEVGRYNHPILLKRGFSATIQEYLFAAEYIALQGNRKIILCERGIRTFETETRNTLDISAVPIIKMKTQLPILVDISHSLGRKDIMAYIAKAALAAGSDGLMVEVHPFPELALSDSKQQLNLNDFMILLNSINSHNFLVHKSVDASAVSDG